MKQRPAAMIATVAIVVLLAIGLRCLTLFYVDALALPPAEDRSIAIHLLDGRGFSFTAFNHTGPTSIRPPVYPMLLASLYAIFGVDSTQADIAALAINVLAGAAGVAVAYSIGLAIRRKSNAGDDPDHRLALLLAIGVAILPTQLYAGAYAQGLSIAFLLMLTAVRLALSPDLRLAALAGVVAGLAVLTESALWLPLLGLTLLVAWRNRGFATLMLAGAIVVVSPWLYRNAIVQGQIVGVTNELWPDVFRGNGPDATGSIHLRTRTHAGKPQSRIDRLSPIEIDQLKRQPERVRNDLQRRWSLNWIREQPLQYLKLCAVRAGKTLWLDWDHPKAWNALNVASRSALLLGLAMACVAALRKSTTCGVFSVALVLMIGLVLASAFTLAEARNAAFIDFPQLLVLAWVADRKLG